MEVKKTGMTEEMRTETRCKEGYILGIDIGTTGTKCTVYSAEGVAVAHAYREYPMLCPEPGTAEQDPEVWWRAVCSSLKECLSRQRIDASLICTVGISCTNAVVLVDEQGNALCRAIGLHDKRSVRQVEWLRKHVGEELVEKITANHIAGGTFTLPTLRWLMDNRPELIQKAYRFLMPDGYIIQKLTGRFTINRPRMSFTLLSDIERGEWSEILIERAGFPRRLLPEPFDSCETVGTVTEQASLETGLAKGTAVTAGCLDTAAAALGSGAVQVGDFAITLGSSGRICCISREPVRGKRMLNCPAPLGGGYTVIQSTDNCGISLRWFRDLFGETAKGQARRGECIYDCLSRLAGEAEPGSGGLLYLPYLSGEKSPIWNARARGVLFGMKLNTTYGECVRAVMEGVACSIRDCMNEVSDYTSLPELIPLGGGIGNSRIWCQIMADMLGCRILMLENSETETLGDMIIAAAGQPGSQITKEFGKQAAEGRILEPDPENRRKYEEVFKRYKELYERVEPMF